MAEILQVDSLAPQREVVAQAVDLIRGGQVIAIPTDTFYGLAADPFQAPALERVFTVKNRPPHTAILLLVDSVEMATSLSRSLPDSFHALTKRYWPGPLTIVVEASERIPAVVTANTGRVGLRLPAAAVPRAIVAALQGPITGTSANQSGRPPCGSAAEVEESLGKFLPLILDGGTSPATTPSTVVSLRSESWELIREGAIRRGELEVYLRGMTSAQ